MSISMTVLNPFSESLEMGARKFPAAPARDAKDRLGVSGALLDRSTPPRTANDKVDPPKFLNSLCDRLLEQLRVPDIRLNRETLVTSRSCEFFCAGL